jgi:probable F420-dependent oxidoreductase
MRFGIGQFTLQVPPWDARTHAELYADTLSLAAFAEEHGFDSFWLAEHHGAGDGYNPSLLPFLAAVAARTTRMELGTAVLLAPFHDPLRIAEDAAVVDNLSGGRLHLGLGLGWSPEEYRMFGVDTAGRGARLAEFVAILRGAWGEDRFSHAGRFYTYDDVAVTPKPARPGGPPIWLGGGADAAIERAARLGDGHFPPSTAGVEGIVAHAERMLALRARIGVTGPYRFGTFLPVGIGTDEDDGWSKIRDGVLHVRGAYLLWSQQQRDLSDAKGSVAQFEDVVRAGSVVGTVQQVTARLRPIVDGLRALDLHEPFISAILAPPGVQPDVARQQVEAFGEVIAALRA